MDDDLYVWTIGPNGHLFRPLLSAAEESGRRIYTHEEALKAQTEHQALTRDIAWFAERERDIEKMIVEVVVKRHGIPKIANDYREALVQETLLVEELLHRREYKRLCEIELNKLMYVENES